MAQTLTCPFPATLDPLTLNGFQLTIAKLPGVSFFCQEANLPGLKLDALATRTPLSTYHQASNQLEYGKLEVSFLVDAKMDNYAALLGWMEGLGFPLTYQQYTDFRQAQGNQVQASDFSAGTLIILGPNNREVRHIEFVDLLPTSVESLTFTTKAEDVKYAGLRVTFTYDHFILT